MLDYKSGSLKRKVFIYFLFKLKPEYRLRDDWENVDGALLDALGNFSHNTYKCYRRMTRLSRRFLRRKGDIEPR